MKISRRQVESDFKIDPEQSRSQGLWGLLPLRGLIVCGLACSLAMESTHFIEKALKVGRILMPCNCFCYINMLLKKLPEQCARSG